jgi:hypothetical protein
MNFNLNFEGRVSNEFFNVSTVRAKEIIDEIAGVSVNVIKNYFETYCVQNKDDEELFTINQGLVLKEMTSLAKTENEYLFIVYMAFSIIEKIKQKLPNIYSGMMTPFIFKKEIEPNE